METSSAPRYYTREQAAEYLGVKQATLDVWASTKRYNLKYIKVGRLVRYRQEDLEQFLNDRTVVPHRDTSIAT